MNWCIEFLIPGTHVERWQIRESFRPPEVLPDSGRRRERKTFPSDRHELRQTPSWSKVRRNLSLRVSTVETNRDRDQDFSICRDQLLKTVEIVYRVKTKIFYFSIEIFKIETFESRFGCVKIFIKIVEINQDCRDLSRLIENCWDLRIKKKLQCKPLNVITDNVIIWIMG